MEVKNPNEALLSNLDVMRLLKDIQAGRNGHQKPTKDQQNLGTITYETLKYLEGTPCALQAPEHITPFMDTVSEFKLTKAEKLQLMNSRPTTMVEMHLIVEESEERFASEEQMEHLRDAVVSSLPGPEPPSPEENEEVEEEEGMEEEEEEEVTGVDYVTI